MTGPSSLVYDPATPRQEERKHLYLKIEIMKGEVLEKSYIVDYSYYRTKTFVVKTLVWCSLQGRTFTLRGASDLEVKSEGLFKPKDRES